MSENFERSRARVIADWIWDEVVRLTGHPLVVQYEPTRARMQEIYFKSPELCGDHHRLSRGEWGARAIHRFKWADVNDLDAAFDTLLFMADNRGRPEFANEPPTEFASGIAGDMRRRAKVWAS